MDEMNSTIQYLQVRARTMMAVTANGHIVSACNKHYNVWANITQAT